MKKIYLKFLPLAIGFYFNVLALFSKPLAAKKAFLLFCSPRKGKVLPPQYKFLNDARYKRFSVDDMEIQSYHWEGKRETVLLLHGWESNAFRWRNLIQELRKEGYNILAIDAPAHGYSDSTLFNVPRYTKCVAKAVSLFKPDFLIGHSVGGMTAIYHQHLNPKNTLKKIVSIGAPSDLEDIIKRYQQLLCFSDRVHSALDRYFKTNFGFGVQDFSTAEFVKDFKVEGLLIHDELDAIAPFWASEKVHANWKKSTLIRTKGLGHSMHQENVNEQIINFLNSEN